MSLRRALVLPNFGPTADPRSLEAISRDAEAAGWEGVFLWDHIVWGPFPTYDPWLLLAVIALATERIAIGPMVTPIPRRRPSKLARETVTLDHISGGRLILGVGSGRRAWEWEGMGEEADPVVRGEMLDEGLQLLVDLWRGEPVAHRGRHYTIVPEVEQPFFRGLVGFTPTPVQTPRIPIWVGGSWPHRRPFVRAARWDGVYPNKVSGSVEPADVQAIVAFVSDHRESPDRFEVAVGGSTPASPRAAAEVVGPFVEAGATWWMERLSPFSFGWEGMGPWPVEQMRERVLAGPPGVAG